MRCMPITVDGVTVTSRYNYWFELSRMATVLRHLGPKRKYIKSIWCDSKIISSYSVTLKKCLPIARDRNATALFATEIGDLFYECYGGHNGIWLYDYNDNELCVVDPQWEIDVCKAGQRRNIFQETIVSPTLSTAIRAQYLFAQYRNQTRYE
jgi:hypothetical protein